MSVELTRVDLSDVADDEGGAIWSLPHGGDLDANLVRLSPGQQIAQHINYDVDVLMIVRSGSGDMVVDGERLALAPDTLVLVPCGAARAIDAGTTGISYLSIHRRRGPLEIATD